MIRHTIFQSAPVGVSAPTPTTNNSQFSESLSRIGVALGAQRVELYQLSDAQMSQVAAWDALADPARTLPLDRAESLYIPISDMPGAPLTGAICAYWTVPRRSVISVDPDQMRVATDVARDALLDL